MKILVLGGTGTVGSHVVRELAGLGAEVSVLTRNPSKARDLPKGTEAVQGDLMSPATIRSAFDGMDGVFLLNAVSDSESHQGLLAINGARVKEKAMLRPGDRVRVGTPGVEFTLISTAAAAREDASP